MLSVTKALCKCADVSDISARVSCIMAQREGAFEKAVRRCSDVGNVWVLGRAWG